MRRIALILVPLLVLTSCGGEPQPEPPTTTGPAVESTLPAEPPPSSSAAPSPTPTPIPEPSPTPVQPLVEHALAEPLGLTQPSLSVELGEARFMGGDVVAIVHDGDEEVSVTAWTYDGQQAWQERIRRPEPGAVLVVGHDSGLEVISVWFTTADHGDTHYGDLRPVVGDIWWKELTETMRV